MVLPLFHVAAPARVVLRTEDQKWYFCLLEVITVSIEIQKDCLCLVEQTFFTQKRMITIASKLKSVGYVQSNSWFSFRGDDHGSIETQKSWFCFVKIMVFNKGGVLTVASKLKSVGFAQ